MVRAVLQVCIIIRPLEAKVFTTSLKRSSLQLLGLWASSEAYAAKFRVSCWLPYCSIQRAAKPVRAESADHSDKAGGQRAAEPFVEEIIGA